MSLRHPFNNNEVQLQMLISTKGRDSDALHAFWLVEAAAPILSPLLAMPPSRAIALLLDMASPWREHRR